MHLRQWLRILLNYHFRERGDVTADLKRRFMTVKRRAVGGGGGGAAAPPINCISTGYYRDARRERA